MTALEVLGIPRTNICPLEISNEGPLEIRPVTDAVERKEFEPCSNMLPHTDGEVLDDEVVIIHSSGLAGESKVFEPYTEVRLPGVPSDVGGQSEVLWERCFLDAATKGPWPRAIRARAPVVRLAATPRVHVLVLLSGPARANAARSCHHSMAVIIVPGVASIVDDATSIMVLPEPFVHRWSVWSGCQVGLRHNHGHMLHDRQLLW